MDGHLVRIIYAQSVLGNLQLGKSTLIRRRINTDESYYDADANATE